MAVITLKVKVYLIKWASRACTYTKAGELVDGKNAHRESSAGKKPENPVETDSSWGAVRRGGARTTSLPLRTGWGIKHESGHSLNAGPGLCRARRTWKRT